MNATWSAVCSISPLAQVGQRRCQVGAAFDGAVQLRWRDHRGQLNSIASYFQAARDPLTCSSRGALIDAGLTSWR